MDEQRPLWIQRGGLYQRSAQRLRTRRRSAHRFRL